MSNTKKNNISAQYLELAEAVPKVMMNRFTQMANVRSQPSPKDVVEFNRMWSEKMLVAVESWSEIYKESFRYQNKIVQATAGYWSAPWMMPHVFLTSSMTYGPNAVKRVIGSGLAPIHKMALANAERLSEEEKS